LKMHFVGSMMFLIVRASKFAPQEWLGFICSIGLGSRRRFKRESKKLAALHWGSRTQPSVRSPSVLEHYATLISRAFDLAFVVVGRCTFSTLSRNSAVTFVLSGSSGRVELRRKLPKERSRRWNFLFWSSFSLLRSPETQRIPSSTVTLTSSFFISGKSALSRYS